MTMMPQPPKSDWDPTYVRASGVNQLVTIPNVPIITTGSYGLMSGPATFTSEDLIAAVAALDDPAINTPVMKLGHVDPRFDGEPAIGKVENMHLGDEGHTIYGDLVGLPRWLADIMPTAYPRRSIEGWFNYASATGHTHRFVITGLALLGIETPGVETLEDLKLLFSAEGPAEVDTVLAAAIGRSAMSAKVKVTAAVEVDDVRRAFFEQVAIGDQYYWWIREFYIDPPEVIIDDDSGNIRRMSYELKGSEVIFGDPVEVTIVYKDKTGSTKASAAMVFASRAESRPSTEPEKGEIMDLNELRKLLGLGEDVSDEDVKAKAIEALSAPEPTASPEPIPAPEPVPAPEPAPVAPALPEVPEGMVLIDKDTLEQTKLAASRGELAYHRQLKGDRDEVLDNAIKAGKFQPSRREHYAKLLAADPEGTAALIETLAAGIIPVDERGGQDHGPDAVAASAVAYPPEWLPELAGRVAGHPQIMKEA